MVKVCVIKCESHQPGSVIEIEEPLARDLMVIGRVVPHDEEEPVNRSVGLEGSEEEPVKRRGRPKKEETLEEESPEE